MCPIYWCPENFQESMRLAWVRPRLLFPKLLMGFCSDQSYECEYNIWSSYIALPIRSWDNRGYKTLSSPWIRARFLFSKNCNVFLFGWTLCMYRPKLKSVTLPVPEIIATEVLGGVANPQSWGRGGRRGSGMVQFERALVLSYLLACVITPMSSQVCIFPNGTIPDPLRGPINLP